MSHKSRLAALVIDCRCDDLSEHVAFWSGALGYEPVYFDEEPDYVGLGVPGDEVTVILQRVDHDSRVHLDIETDDQEAEVKRLEALGAKRVADIKRWVVMEAPSGHRFCVVNPQRRDFASNANRWPDNGEDA
jgi:catechol 2,3-dioxygenase-like lactoylglutathione lyase family enzyme